MKITNLRKKRNTAIKAMRAMLDAADAEGATDLLNQEDYAALQAEVDSINVRIEQEEVLTSQEVTLTVADPSVGQAATVAEAAEPGATLAASVGARGVEAVKEFETSADFLAAVIMGGKDQRLVFQESKQGLHAEQRMDTGAKGGFMVPTQLASEFLSANPANTPLLNLVRRLQAGTPPDAGVIIPALDQSTDTNDAPDHQYGGVQVNWTAEGGTISESDADLREVKLEPEEISAHVAITDKLKRNWPAVGSLMAGLLGQALNGTIEAALFNGDGVAKPHGILRADALIPINRTTTLTVVYADICAMVERMMPGGGPAFWLVNQLQMANLMQMVNANNNLIWTNDNAVAGSPGSISGIPVIWYEHAPAIGAKGDVMLVQPQYYLLKPGSGPFVASGHSGTDFLTNRERLKIFTNVDGGSWLTQPWVQRNGNEVSPFIALDVP